MECGNSSTTDGSAMRVGVWPPYWPHGPYWPFPQLSVGDLHGTILGGLQKFLDGRRDGDRSLRAAVAELAATGAVGREELTYLNKLVRIAAGDNGPRMLDAMRALQADMLMSVRPMPIVAQAIISIGIDSLSHELTRGEAFRLSVAKEDLEGGAAGATIGGAIGGPVGAVIGALAGGITLSCLAAREARELRELREA